MILLSHFLVRSGGYGKYILKSHFNRYFLIAYLQINLHSDSNVFFVCFLNNRNPIFVHVSVSEQSPGNTRWSIQTKQSYRIPYGSDWPGKGHVTQFRLKRHVLKNTEHKKNGLWLPWWRCTEGLMAGAEAAFLGQEIHGQMFTCWGSWGESTNPGQEYSGILLIYIFQ